MSRIKGKDTKPEIVLRHVLHAKGFRYRKNVKSLPGKPDIVLPKYHTIIFVHGCFWHRHEGCKQATTPKSRTDFWLEKFQKNVQNDAKHIQELKNMGWKVIVLWECELEKQFEETMRNVIAEIRENAC